VATVPSPKTWDVGEVVDDDLLNAELKATSEFFLTQPSLLVSRSNSQSINNASWTPVTWNTTYYDSDAMHPGNSDTVTVVTAGIYDIRAVAMWTANVTGGRGISVDHNNPGTTVIARGGALSSGSSPGEGDENTITTVQTATMRALAVGDTIKVFVWQESGGALNLLGDATANLWSFLSVRWIAKTP
jgi:hypothetical protein